VKRAGVPGQGRRWEPRGPLAGAGRPTALTLISLVVVMSLVLPPSAPATARTIAPTGERDEMDPRALLLLERASRADEATAYDGVQFISAWGPHGATSHLVEIDNMPGRGTAVRLHGTPGVEETAAFRAAEAGVAPTGANSALRLLARNYDLAYAGQDAVAGRAADLVEVQRRDDAGLAARFWLDAQTGVPLRREVYDRAGRTIRASAFVDVRVGEPVWMTHLPPLLPDPEEARMSPDRLAALREAGWTCPERVGGGLALQGARRLEDARGPIVHLTYSDGLSTVSLFEQRGRLDVSRLAGFQPVPMGDGVVHVREGVPRYLVWSAGGSVYTVVADAPPETVGEVMAALPAAEGSDTGVVPRIRRGILRVASWFSPFG
jgi:negative regulator of sigma E activity